MTSRSVAGALAGVVAAFVLGPSLRNTGVLLSRALRARSRSHPAIAPGLDQLLFARAPGLTGIVLLVVGCGSTLGYGSFLQGRPRVEAAMAADAAHKLAADYDPAERSIWLTAERSDALGRVLSAELRKAGFKVRSGGTQRAQRELPVRYVADVIKGTELCRITLSVDRRSLSRAYTERGSAIYPAGPWSVDASAEASAGGR